MAPTAGVRADPWPPRSSGHTWTREVVDAFDDITAGDPAAPEIQRMRWQHETLPFPLAQGNSGYVTAEQGKLSPSTRLVNWEQASRSARLANPADCVFCVIASGHTPATPTRSSPTRRPAERQPTRRRLLRPHPGHPVAAAFWSFPHPWTT